jgi:hypothetical protein
MEYWKYRWSESRGDEHDDWGCSWWYFEIGPDGYAARQIEIYDAGVRLRYGPDHQEDEYGGLSYYAETTQLDRPPDEVITAAGFITAADFDAIWETGPWHNG